MNVSNSIQKLVICDLIHPEKSSHKLPLSEFEIVSTLSLILDVYASFCMLFFFFVFFLEDMKMSWQGFRGSKCSLIWSITWGGKAWDSLLVCGWKDLCVSRSKPWRCYPLLRHLTPPHLLIRPASQRKHGPMIPVCSTQALIHQAQDSYFLSRHGKVALNSDVVERKPFSFAWKELKSNNCLSSHSPCGIKSIINT